MAERGKDKREKYLRNEQNRGGKVRWCERGKERNGVEKEDRKGNRL